MIYLFYSWESINEWDFYWFFTPIPIEIMDHISRDLTLIKIPIIRCYSRIQWEHIHPWNSGEIEIISGDILIVQTSGVYFFLESSVSPFIATSKPVFFHVFRIASGSVIPITIFSAKFYLFCCWVKHLSFYKSDKLVHRPLGFHTFTSRFWEWIWGEALQSFRGDYWSSLYALHDYSRVFYSHIAG